MPLNIIEQISKRCLLRQQSVGFDLVERHDLVHERLEHPVPTGLQVRQGGQDGLRFAGREPEGAQVVGDQVGGMSSSGEKRRERGTFFAWGSLPPCPLRYVASSWYSGRCSMYRR
ncbi:hypothetical protein [Deinococcus sp. LM3]|uniref:hypothetical protein n=1 Tax=Deinococcus sp. LM3 TaxID=1938608 RepID=UPI0009D18E76|nr:hypothetical protein [Deinococcus sp. LM3]OOV11376.1 hypothetical protein BXU09_20125 [Deinococcus sp. LM3]